MPVVKQRAEVPETKEPATSKKLEYEQFLKIIELIAEKFYPGLKLNAAVETVISQHLMKIKLIQADASTQLAESLKTLEDFIALVSTPDMVIIIAIYFCKLSKCLLLGGDFKTIPGVTEAIL